MRKKFLNSKLGTEEMFWERNTQDSNIKEAVRFCEISPIRPILDKFFPQEGKILDGGCGLGQFVIYYTKKGYDIEGIDFSLKQIERILSYDSSIKVKEADILNLPYLDNYFKAYYSGGVMEHFEDGPFLALQEAHRVLDKDGLLIITVPYFNLSRRICNCLLFRFRKRKSSGAELDFNGVEARFLLTNTHKRIACPFPGFSFHQYEYTKSKFSRILKDCGFDIIFSRGTSIIWGLMDSALLRKLINRTLSDSQDHSSQKYSESIKISQSIPKSIQEKVKDYLKGILISENYNLFFGSLILKVLQFTSANLILFVCKARK